ncbi:MAG TPA: hypothetical protein VFG76_00310 [Candidatus Polarisedimenticolia bacterium]|nr:hypothetical protein [Candidatus Polarisedimenticolia bacterium]
MTARLALAALCLGITGCVQALREPPPLSDLGGAGHERRPIPAPGEVGALLTQADVLYTRRDLASVREAAALWLDAARADTRRVEGLAGATRAFVWIVEHEPSAGARVEAATTAVQAAQWCARIAPDNAACAYWLGASLGVQARERHATGLDALPLIEQAFKRAAQLDPTQEDAGPDRALALLYLRAPGWPTGPGDPDLGLTHARRAVELKPEHAPNHLALGEALVATGDVATGGAEYRRALELARNDTHAAPQDAAEWIQEAEKALAEAPRND